MSKRVELWQRRVSEGHIDFADLEDDLREMDTEVEQGEADLQERRASLDALKQDRDALMGLRNFVAHASPGSTLMAAVKRSKNGRKGTKRDVILDILGSANHALPIGDIRDALVESGAIEPTSGAYHALQVTLSQMFRDGQLARPRQGLYELSPVGAIQK